MHPSELYCGVPPTTYPTGEQPGLVAGGPNDLLCGGGDGPQVLPPPPPLVDLVHADIDEWLAPHPIDADPSHVLGPPCIFVCF